MGFRAVIGTRLAAQQKGVVQVQQDGAAFPAERERKEERNHLR